AYYPNGFPGPDQEGGVQPVVSGKTQTGYNHIQSYFLSGDVALDITIPGIKGFDIKGTFSYNKEFQDQKNWQIPWTLYSFDKQAYLNNNSQDPTQFLKATLRGPTDPQLTQSFYQQQNTLSNLVANYKHDFGDHKMSLMAGTEQQNFNQSNFNAFRRHFISTTLPELFAGGQQDWSNDGSAAHGARASFFSRANYAYKDRYLLEFVGRYDGSYLFPSNKRFGFFPAFSGGWRISNEPFFNNVSFFNDLKLRASWGKTGNDITNPNALVEAQQFLSGYQFGSSYVLGIDQVLPSIYQSREANPNATWERSNQTDIGIDATMLKNRLSFTIDYWSELRSGILIQRNASVPQSTGLTLPRENLGKVRSWGYDGTILWNEQVKKDLSFQVRLTWGYSNNKIVFWDEAPGAPSYQVSTNKKIGTTLYYQTIGVFQTQAEVDKYPHWTGARSGDLIFKDVDGNGKIDADDRVRINSVHTPDWTGGITLGSRWKQLSISIFFQGASGGAQYISTESGDIGNYLGEYAEQRWIPDPTDPKGLTPSPAKSTYSGPRTFNRGDTYWSPQASNNNTYFLRSTNYIRLKTMEIGYNVPKEFLSKYVGIRDLRIYANGFNLITWDKFKIMDPEVSNAAGDYYPQARIFNFGLNLTF
ncbi:MAG: SusC/RagA family TonB-linked outer membrane protein, partial [Ginsengibacter sp.]